MICYRGVYLSLLVGAVLGLGSVVGLASGDRCTLFQLLWYWYFVHCRGIILFGNMLLLSASVDVLGVVISSDEVAV